MDAEYIKVVEEGDIISVRISLLNEMLLDPRGKSFDKMRSYTEAKLTGLYEPDNGEAYSVNENEWNEDFLFNIKNDLDSNFSRERLDFYVKVAKYVLIDKAKNLEKEETKMRRPYNPEFQTNRHKEKAQVNSRKQLYKGVIVGGTAFVVAGICLSKVILTSLGVGGIAIGGYLLYKEK